MELNQIITTLAFSMAVSFIWIGIGIIFILPVDAKTGFAFHQKIKQRENSLMLDFIIWPYTCAKLITNHRAKKRKINRRHERTL